MEKGLKRKLLAKLRLDKFFLYRNVQSLKEIEISKEKNWGIYDYGAHDIPKQGHSGYFGKGMESFAKIMTFQKAKDYFNFLSEKTKEIGRKSLALDVLGQGRIGFDLGAKKSVGWTYKDLPIENLEGREIWVGDLFDQDVLENHIKELDRLIDKEGYDLNAVFFRAVCGFFIYYSNLYALSKLYEKVFLKIYSRMKIGARMYLSMPNYGSEANDTNYVEKLMIVLKGMGYWITSDGDGNYVLEKSPDKLELPTLKKVMEIDPLVTEKTFEKLSKIA
jgi:hypothetical protein